MRSNHHSKYKINQSADKGYFGNASTHGNAARYQQSIDRLVDVLAFSDTSDKDRSLVTMSNYISELNKCRTSSYYESIKSGLTMIRPNFYIIVKSYIMFASPMT